MNSKNWQALAELVQNKKNSELNEAYSPAQFINTLKNLKDDFKKLEAAFTEIDIYDNGEFYEKLFKLTGNSSYKNQKDALTVYNCIKAVTAIGDKHSKNSKAPIFQCSTCLDYMLRNEKDIKDLIK